MLVKTANLKGTALDWAVAKCEGGFDLRLESTYGTNVAWQFSFRDDEDVNLIDRHYLSDYEPASDWSQGGPIIEREGIGILFDAGSACRKPSWFATPDDHCTTSSYEGEQFDPTFMVSEDAGMRGPTPLIAAMRCYVASKLGDEIEIPNELLEN